MLREMGDALEVLSQREPLALLLEDLHWADPSSSDLLHLLGQRAARCRLLVIATCRAEQLELEGHPLLNIRREMLAHDQCEDLALPLLGSEGISRYLEARFSPHAFPAELAALITSTTEGQPLFATRLVQLLLERGDIIQAGGRFQLGRALEELHLGVPDSVRGLIQKKLESLNAEDARALSYASVIGAEFSSGLLARVLGVDEILLEERLDHLARAQRWVEPLGDERLPDGQLSVCYRFSHVLYQNVLYESLASRRRVQLHAQVAELMVSRHADRANLHAARIAKHFEQAREVVRAIPFLMQAADNAGRLHANREALQYYARALSLVPELPHDARVPHEIILLYNRGWCAFHVGDYDAALADFRAMAERARASSFTSAEGQPARDAVFDYFEQPWKDSFGVFEPPRIPNQRREMGASVFECEALWAQCETLLHADRLEEMGSQIEGLLRLAEASNNEPRRAEALAWLALRELELSNLEGATRYVGQGLPLARLLGHPRALCVVCFVAGHVHYFRSEHERAEAMIVEALALTYEASGRVDCLWLLGLTRANLGRMSEALAALNEAADISRRASYDYHSQIIPSSIGWVHLELGDLEGAIGIAQHGAALAARLGLVEGEIHSWVNLARCHIRRGELAPAGAALARVESLWQHEQATRGHRSWVHHRHQLEEAKGEYLLARGDHGGAESCGRSLLEMATRQHSPKHVAIARLLIAGAALGRGDSSAAELESKAGLDALRDHPTPLISWKLLAALGRARASGHGGAAALDASERALHIVKQITQSITDEGLREKWVGSAPVRELESQVAAALSHADAEHELARPNEALRGFEGP
jgi:tetratricopeptide (TPR) repeat protein